MPEYDAFGREIGKDPLADVGWSETPDAVEATAAPAPVPAPAAAPVSAGQQVAEAAFRDAAPALAVPRRRRGAGCSVGVAVLLLVIGGAAAGGITLLGAAEDAIDDVTRLIPEIPTAVPGAPGTTVSPEEPAAPATPPKGLRKGSLVKRANFARAMRRLRAARLGRLHALRVAPGRIDAQLLTRGGALRNVQLRPDGVIEKFGSATPGFGHLETFEFSKVNSAAPERLTRAAARRLGSGADRVDYLVLFDFAGTMTWAVFFSNGANFQGDAGGNIVRRVS